MNLAQIRWPGYLRQDGRKGIRNKILVIFTVECSSFVAREIVHQIDDPEVEVVGFSGCTDNDYALRLLVSLIRHPNIGGVLIVGLGCEYLQPEKLAETALKAGKESSWLFIQNEGGTKRAINRGIELIEIMKQEIAKVQQVSMGISDLIVGGECGGSDYTSGLAGNMVVGRFNDRLVKHGGTAIFEEIVEAVGLKEQLVKRAGNEKAAAELANTYEKALVYCCSVRQYSVSPGNFAGGLSSIEEKSMGALIKSGTQPIKGVLKVGIPPNEPGLWLLDTTPDLYWMQFGITNPNDNEGLLDLISCGCQLVFLVTGRGNVVGSAVSPCIKITGNSQTYARMIDDMDFDAGRVLSGELSPSELTEELIKLVIEVASGEKTKSERLGHKEFFIPYKYQDVSKYKKCEENI